MFVAVVSKASLLYGSTRISELTLLSSVRSSYDSDFISSSYMLRSVCCWLSSFTILSSYSALISLKTVNNYLGVAFVTLISPSCVLSHEPTAFSRKVNLSAGLSISVSSINSSSTISDQSVGSLARMHFWKAFNIMVCKNNCLGPIKGLNTLPRIVFLKHVL